MGEIPVIKAALLGAGTVGGGIYEILERQSGYFLRGEALKPMTQEEIAQALKISSSTVIRAVQGKYLQYQRTVLLQALFSAVGK